MEKKDEFDEKDFELHGAIQVLHDYTLMHLRKRECVESIGLHTLRNELKPFDSLVSFKRLKRQTIKVQDLIARYAI